MARRRSDDDILAELEVLDAESRALGDAQQQVEERTEPGFTPENPIQEQHPQAGPLRRRIMNLATSPAQAQKILRQAGFDAFHLGGLNFAVKKAKEDVWRVLDPSGFDLGDIADIGGDVLSAVASGFGVAGGAAAGGPAGALAGGAAGGVAAEGLKQAIAAQLGLPVSGEGVTREAALGAGGALIGPAVGAAARGVSRLVPQSARQLLGLGERELLGEAAEAGVTPILRSGRGALQAGEGRAAAAPARVTGEVIGGAPRPIDPAGEALRRAQVRPAIQAVEEAVPGQVVRQATGPPLPTPSAAALQRGAFAGQPGSPFPRGAPVGAGQPLPVTPSTVGALGRALQGARPTEAVIPGVEALVAPGQGVVSTALAGRAISPARLFGRTGALSGGRVGMAPGVASTVQQLQRLTGGQVPGAPLLSRPAREQIVAQILGKQRLPEAVRKTGEFLGRGEALGQKIPGGIFPFAVGAGVLEGNIGQVSGAVAALGLVGKLSGRAGRMLARITDPLERVARAKAGSKVGQVVRSALDRLSEGDVTGFKAFLFVILSRPEFRREVTEVLERGEREAR